MTKMLKLENSLSDRSMFILTVWKLSKPITDITIVIMGAAETALEAS